MPSGYIVNTLWKNKVSSFKKYPLGFVLGTFWKCPPLTCWVWAGWIGGHFLKMTNMYLLGMSWANWWVLFKCAHYLPPGFGLGKWVGTFWMYPLFTHWVWAERIVSEPTINSQCTHWVYCPSPPVSSSSESPGSFRSNRSGGWPHTRIRRGRAPYWAERRWGGGR